MAKRKRVKRPGRNLQRAVNRLTRQHKNDHPDASDEEIAQMVSEDLEDMGYAGAINISAILALVQAFAKVLEFLRK